LRERVVRCYYQGETMRIADIFNVSVGMTVYVYESRDKVVCQIWKLPGVEKHPELGRYTN